MLLRFLPILKKAELAYAMRSAWLHLALTAILTLGITIWSRSAKAIAQTLMASCSSLLNTLIFAANQSSESVRKSMDSDNNNDTNDNDDSTNDDTEEESPSDEQSDVEKLNDFISVIRAISLCRSSDEAILLRGCR